MGNTTSFTNVTQVVETHGGLLLDASTFANMSTYGSLNLAFNTVWVANAQDEETPIGPYETTLPETHYENLSGTWTGARLVDFCAVAFFTNGDRCWGAGPVKGRSQK
jgi:hypothetical protein